MAQQEPLSQYAHEINASMRAAMRELAPVVAEAERSFVEFSRAVAAALHRPAPASGLTVTACELAGGPPPLA